ncbi:hypothetical protein VQ643_16335, partial [Pseudomonas sp. F1_0610]|uniref:hypothetical protein n=1 Tax=Pseudomonas sp. F1_0610 TaxID=3114284 RepID=UPI0039C4C2C5
HFEYSTDFDQVTRYTSPKGIVAKLTYDTNGNVINVIEALGSANERQTHFIYDQYGQASQITIGNGNNSRTIKLKYDNNGNINELTDSKGNTY